MNKKRSGVVIDIETILRPENLAGVLLFAVPHFGPLILPYENTVLDVWIGPAKHPILTSLCWDEWVDNTWLGQRPQNIIFGDLASTSALWIKAKERGFVRVENSEFGNINTFRAALEKWFVPVRDASTDFNAFDYLEPYRKILVGEDVYKAFVAGQPVKVGIGLPLRLLQQLEISMELGGKAPLPLFISCRRHRSHLRRMIRVPSLQGNKEMTVGFKIGRFERVAVQQNLKDGNIERFLDLVEQRVSNPGLFDSVVSAAIGSVKAKLSERLGFTMGGAAVGTILGIIFAGPIGTVPGAILGGVLGAGCELAFAEFIAQRRS